MPRLAGKVAFITGISSGIGRATAILFAEGAKVVIAEIDARTGEETAYLAGNEAIAIRADVTDPGSLQAAIRSTVDKFGRLDVLHNNAGGSTAQDDTAVNAPRDEFWRAIKLDLYGTFLVPVRHPRTDQGRRRFGDQHELERRIDGGTPDAIAIPRQRVESRESPGR
jgi:NAD(P)-dependent dehydrogenase (short-subunit alcohol dehydrogenase family)